MLNALLVAFDEKDETKVCLPFVKMKKETLRSYRNVVGSNYSQLGFG